MVSVQWIDKNAYKVWMHLNDEVERRYNKAMHLAKFSIEEDYKAQREFIESTKLIRDTMSEFYRKYTAYVFTPNEPKT